MAQRATVRGVSAPDPLALMLAEILTRLGRIETMLARGRRPRDADDQRVLMALAASVGSTRFSAAEVIRHSTVDHELRAALEQADCCDNPRSLGRLFRRIEGRAVNGVALARVGEDRQGPVWVLRVCVTTPDRA